MSFVHELKKLEDPGKQFLTAEVKLDTAATGPRWLGDPKIAGYVEEAIKRGIELGHYVMYAYVLMPNHVHILINPLVPLRRITGGIKGVSARDANGALGRTGKAFWQDESFDHWIRNDAQLERIQSYIEYNPVKAGLVAKPEDWQWSSAHK
jgi:REP element-mobilizing transposase RayT